MLNSQRLLLSSWQPPEVILRSYITEYVTHAGPRSPVYSWLQLWTDLEFSRLESWSRDVSRPIFTSLGLGLGLEPRSLGLGLGLGTSESWSRSWSWNPPVSVSVLVTLRTPNSDPWVEVARSDTYKVLHPLLEKVFCPPATSAPVEQIFSRSGLLMRANVARMGDNMLSQLVYLRCNNKL